MKLSCGCVLAAGLFLAIAGQAQPASGQTIRLVGKVVDSSSNAIAGAAIVAYPRARDVLAEAFTEPTQPVMSAEDGSFKLELLSPGCEVLVRKPGLAPAWWQGWNLRQDVEQTFVLHQPMALAGRVADSSGQPLANAKVFVVFAFAEQERPGGGRSFASLSGKLARQCFSAKTSADGAFRIEQLPPNTSADLAIQFPGKVLRPPQRDYVSPENMMCRSGDTNVQLVVEPAGEVRGQLVFEGAGTVDREALSTARVILTHQRMVGQAIDPARVREDGTFSIPNLVSGEARLMTRFGTNPVPDWVAPQISVSIRASEPAEPVRIVAVKGSVVRVSVLADPDRTPVADTTVQMSGPDYNASIVTGAEGSGWSRVVPGEYQAIAYKASSRSAPVAFTAESGVTNEVEMTLRPPPVVAGKVTTADGQPAAGARVQIFPNWFGPEQGRALTDSEGRYRIEWDASRFGSGDRSFALVATDTNRNLVGAADLEPEARELDVTLGPGLTILGRVEDVDGKGLGSAALTVFLWAGNSGSTFEAATRVTPDGRFSIANLPPGRRYSVSASAPGYGSSSREAPADSENVREVEVEPFALRVADRKLAGRVVDSDDKPISGAWVHLYGEDQPNGSTRSDAEGRFAFDAVCEGVVRLSASAQNAFGNISAEGGDTNVVLQLGRQGGYQVSAPRRTGLTGRPLPDLAPVGIPKESLAAGQALLLCLIDAEQRPSRRCLRILAEQFETWKARGLAVAALQSAILPDESWTEWSAENPLPFPLGRVTEKKPECAWATEVETLPWLILRNAEGSVVAEGFDLEELEDKLQALKK